MLYWSCKSARSFSALRTMCARHAVLLTPLECAVPRSILISILSARINPLESALRSHSKLIENTTTLSLLECALMRFSPATPLECAVTKNTGVGGAVPLIPHLVIRHSSLATILKFFLFTLLRTLLRFFALTKYSTLLFSSDSALFAKNTRGWG